MNDMKTPMPNPYAAAQAEYDKQGMMNERKAKADASAMGCGHSGGYGKMNDTKYNNMQHEASESPAYERMEEKGVKLLKAMKGAKGGY